MKKFVIEFIKLLIAFGLFYYLFKAKVPIGEVVQNIKNLKIFYLVITFFLFFIFYLSFSLRWNSLLRAQEIYISEGRSYLYLLISFFFNNFLPSAVGMDLVRSAYAGGKENFEKAFGASIMERMLGMIGILVIGVFGIFSGKIKFVKLALLYLGLIFFTIFLYYLFVSMKVEWLKKKILSIKVFNLGKSIKEFYRALKIYKNKKKTILIGTIYSVIVQIIITLINYFIAKGLSVQLPFSALIAYLPLITIISLVPITLNGLGLREGAYVFFLSSFIRKSEAFSISLVFFASFVLTSCVGGIVFIILPRESKRLTIKRVK
ncbi:MAG: lysylphosphatidylglycerol synthase transmembrane domain-containing protein [candidate division WOR-3 bacterium]